MTICITLPPVCEMIGRTIKVANRLGGVNVSAVKKFLAVLTLIVLVGCSATPAMWENWEESEEMLPSGFPRLVRDEYRVFQWRAFLIQWMDCDGDTLADIRIWWPLDRHEYDRIKDIWTFVKSHYPYRVEQLDDDGEVRVAKVDHMLTGRREYVELWERGSIRIITKKGK